MPLTVVAIRGTRPESRHRVHVAVVDPDGRLVASAGDPDLVTFWRSAAKPFQAIPLVADGAAARYRFDDRDLALACASHSSEPVHLDLAAGMLAKLGLGEETLACGPHPPLSPEVAEYVVRHGVTMTPRWSNCSGKHAGMLALALFHGWPLEGYQREGHPVQRRILAEIERWTARRAGTVGLAVDGCTAVTFALPLRAMAGAYARLGTSDEAGARMLRRAMGEHPVLVAGQGRLCTELGLATRGAVIAKVGADGIYCAAIPAAGLGIALKVEDGDMRSAPPALLAVLADLSRGRDLGFDPDTLPASVTRHAAPPIVNTRGAVTGTLEARGGLRFSARPGVKTMSRTRP
jgi:L-asparaginase II